MTKAELNARFAPLTASKLKTTSRADLIERRDATQAEVKALHSVDDKIRDGKIVKAPSRAGFWGAAVSVPSERMHSFHGVF